jgi:hypothetical protein
MLGLEPGIQAAPSVIIRPTSALDARVKPAHDEEAPQNCCSWRPLINCDSVTAITSAPP